MILTKEKLFERTVIKLIDEVPFYGLFMSGLNVVWSKQIPTAAIVLYKKTFELEFWFNPDFFESLVVNKGNNEIGAIIAHELLHIVEGHPFSDWFNRDDPDDAKLANVAMDLFINQYQEKSFCLPKGALDIYDPQFAKYGFKPNDSAIEYYKILKKKGLPECLQPQYGFMLVDENGNPVDPATLSSEEMSQLKNSVQHEVHKAVKNCIGNLPQAVEQSVFWKPTVPVVKWETHFRRFSSSVPQPIYRFTRNRPSRRGTEYGQRMSLKKRLLVAWDVSGSVCDDFFVKGMNETHAIWKKGVDVSIVQIDTEIQDKLKYDGRWPNLKRKGHGGTDLTELVEYFLKGDFDGMVVFTDGYFSVNEQYLKLKKKKTLWVHYPGTPINQELPGMKISMN